MNDQAIAAMGRHALAELPDAAPYQLYIQNPHPRFATFPLFELRFKLFTNPAAEWQAQWLQARQVEVNHNRYPRYAYRKGSARGGDITFTTKYGDPRKKLSTWLKQVFPNAVQAATGKEKAQLAAIQLALEQHTETIIATLAQQAEAIADTKVRNRCCISIVAELDGQDLYAKDWAAVQQLLLVSGTEGNAKKYNTTSKTTDQQCSICLQKKPEIYGFASPFKYATADKPGMVAGFFRQSLNWKNYPICSDCALELEIGEQYLRQHLQRNFYGTNYLLVPQLLVQKQSGKYKKILLRLQELYMQEKQQETVRNEDSFLRMLGDEKDDFLLSFLYFEENPTTKAMTLLGEVKELLPSRFKLLFGTLPDKINQHYFIQNALVAKNKPPQPLHFYFGLLKQFAGTKDFLPLVQKIYSNEAIETEWLLEIFMHKLWESYRQPKSEPATNVLMKAYAILLYLSHLKLIDFEPLEILENPHSLNLEQFMKELENDYSKKEHESFRFELLQQYFEAQSAFFRTPGLKGVFAMGVLVRLLISLQYNSLKATPFTKKLKGYDLTLLDLQKVFNEAVGLLEKYSKLNNLSGNLYTELRQLAVDEVAKDCEQLHKLSNIELSFYFVAGKELMPRFKGIKPLAE